ncbi:hypothetical protein JQC92_18810 [Shewanella sp. 202IG2-18]|uniref:hypothetical protein n=1 Tax=Parashewanella hymeniacidonis TaxID=2807618 RepID=UPI00195FFB2C|nr:hypothetical protein [Parashewanella hymeniacidonis]MBM7074057.1 hypothetical protein [Parashewanella hymeniacidonis]
MCNFTLVSNTINFQQKYELSNGYSTYIINYIDTYKFIVAEKSTQCELHSLLLFVASANNSSLLPHTVALINKLCILAEKSTQCELHSLLLFVASANNSSLLPHTVALINKLCILAEIEHLQVS